LKRILLTIIFLAVPAITIGYGYAADWKGTDEAIVEKMAEEHGRAPADPVINTDTGDLPLFVFLVFGAGAGFIAGYYYRGLAVKRCRKFQDKDSFNA
jgi:hypothetical protein